MHRRTADREFTHGVHVLQFMAPQLLLETTAPTHDFMKNGRSNRWVVRRGAEVALTHLGEYYVGRAVVTEVMSCRPLNLCRLVVQDVCERMRSTHIPFPEGELQTIGQCVGRTIHWETVFLRPFVEELDSPLIGGPPTLELDVKPITGFLNLQVDMKVALVTGDGCVGIGTIDVISPRGIWHGCLVPNSFMVVVKLLSVNLRLSEREAFCEDSDRRTMHACIRYRVLWSRHKVQSLDSVRSLLSGPVGPVNPTPMDDHIGEPPLDPTANIQVKVEDEDRGCSNVASDCSSQPSDDDADWYGCEYNFARTPSVPVPGELPFPDRPQWRGMYCSLLDRNCSVYGRGRIMVCLLDEPMDEEVLGDTDVGVLVVSETGEEENHMTTMRWPLTHTRLVGGRLLSEIVILCSERAVSDDDGLDGVPRNPYRSVYRKVLDTDDAARARFTRMTDMAEVQMVSSKRCCGAGCCQKFAWSDTLKLRRQFYSSSFDCRREAAYSVQGQLHTLPRKRKKYITLASVDVCEVAWYSILGIPRSTYHMYKKNAVAGHVTSVYGNSGVLRPRSHTIQAQASIATAIKLNADRMPNQYRLIGQKRANNLLVVPCLSDWNHLREGANAMNEEMKLKPISQSFVSRIKKVAFKNVAVKQVGSNFLKCTECAFLKEFLAKMPRHTDEWVDLTLDKQKHLNYQSACRVLYHGWSAESIESKSEFLCIIHDKMDTCKTAIPRMQSCTKATSGMGQIPMSVTGMLTHGHGDGAYAHYSTALWPGDSNFTISSLCRVLRALEKPPVSKSKKLFELKPQNSFFEALLRGKSRCTSSIPAATGTPTPVPSLGRPAVPLPRRLYLQLDNSAKDNKNRFVMAFCSLLTARRVFKEVTVSFLVVGHTHEDIDAHFSYLSKLLRKKNTYVLANLMKAFMDSQKTQTFVPEFVQEVADFKSYIAPFHHNGENPIVGLHDMHLFKFYVDDDEWPVMRYKRRSTDKSWLPPGDAVRMWIADENDKPRLPPHDVDPLPVKFKPLWGNIRVDPKKKNVEKEAARARDCAEKQGFIQSGISKYIEFWRSGMRRNSKYADDMQPYVQYWEQIEAKVNAALPPTPVKLAEPFWPVSDWKRDHACNPSAGGSSGYPVDTTPEDEDDPYSYCGPRNGRPKELFNPWRDVLVGDFVLCRPCDKHYLPVWLGRAISAVEQALDHPNYGKFTVEWWTPCAAAKEGKKSIARECWTRPWQKQVAGAELIPCSTAIYSYRKPSVQKGIIPKTHNIPEELARAALAALGAHDVVHHWSDDDSD